MSIFTFIHEMVCTILIFPKNKILSAFLLYLKKKLKLYATITALQHLIYYSICFKICTETEKSTYSLPFQCKCYRNTKNKRNEIHLFFRVFVCPTRHILVIIFFSYSFKKINYVILNWKLFIPRFIRFI